MVIKDRYNKGDKMTVKELIEKLKTFPQDMEVCYESYSEMIDMGIQDVSMGIDYYSKEKLIKIMEAKKEQ